jgi:hypothetical protein
MLIARASAGKSAGASRLLQRNPKLPCVPHFFEELCSHPDIRIRKCERTVVEIKVLHEKTNALNSFANLLFERQFCVQRMRDAIGR